MDDQLPAMSVIGVPTKRGTILELAAEADRRGFAGLASPGVHGNLALCGSLAHVTSRIPFWTSIQPIYHCHPTEVAITAGHLAEVSGGRFRLGLGVSHAPAMDRLGLSTGKPLADIRQYVEGLRAAERPAGQLPPIWLATLRDKMLALAVEVADGAIWANASFSHMADQLANIPADRRATFALANMAPTVIDADKDAARAIHRRTLTGYVTLPNYRNYWKAAGYVEEMEGVERALAAGEPDRIPQHLSDRWLSDCTLYGSAAKVRAGVEAWFDAGIKTPILVPSSAEGNQMRAFEELFAAYAAHQPR
jgi:alkanesulfonate monooxygenase SsuD/methylene tetrahydromethanopterin reductase-like flavin-dependent oxidoreductase (luciferase family)